MIPSPNEDGIVGKRVRVLKCEAREHGDNAGCVCHLIGKVVTIDRAYESFFAGTPSYHIRGHRERVRRGEVQFPALAQQSRPTEQEDSAT